MTNDLNSWADDLFAKSLALTNPGATGARTRGDVRKILTDLKPFESFWYIQGEGSREEHQQSITKVKDDLFYLSTTGYYGSEGFYRGPDEVFKELSILNQTEDYELVKDETEVLLIFSDEWAGGADQGIEDNPSFKKTFDTIRSLP